MISDFGFQISKAARNAMAMVCLSTAVALADFGDRPGLHFFTVGSPTNKVVAVHTVRSWPAPEKMEKAHVLQIEQFGRIQMFDSETGKELWRIDGILAYEDGVFPADDGKHLVILAQELWGVGREVKRDQPVMRFYGSGKLIKAHTLDDLKIESGKLVHSVSHSNYFHARLASRSWEWEWPLGSDAARVAIESNEPNPYWKNGAFELVTVDDQRFRFDPATGKVLSATKK